MKYFSIFLFILISACHFNRKGGTNSNISTLPFFTMQLLDSTMISSIKNIPTGKPIILMYFRPDCPHCQGETRTFISNMDALKEVNFYMVSSASLHSMRNYCHAFNLQQYKNITIARDIDQNIAKIFDPSSVPYMAIYNTHKSLIKIYYGEVAIEDIIAAIHS